MLWYHYVLGAVLILLSIFLTVLVLMQEGRSQGLSGAIAGGSSDSYLSKTKGRSNQARLERVTKYLAIGFFILVLAAFLILLFV